MEETGEHVIAGAGELHLEICLKDLQNDFMASAEIIVSDPLVSFCETVLKKPMEQELAKAIDEGHIGSRDDPKAHSKIIYEEFGLDKELGLKIWCFGHETTGPNMVVDRFKGAQYLNEIKDSVIENFNGRLKQVHWWRNICGRYV